MNRELNNLRLELLSLLMNDRVLRKKHFKIVKKVVDNKVQTERVFEGFRPIECKVSDWKKSQIPHRGKASRLRLRILMQKMIEILQEARAITFDLDKMSEDNEISED